MQNCRNANVELHNGCLNACRSKVIKVRMVPCNGLCWAGNSKLATVQSWHKYLCRWLSPPERSYFVHIAKRQNKTLRWQEIRLCLVHEVGSITTTFGATFSGLVADAGKQCYHCAVQAGFGKGTHLHAVGDGATWITDQIDERFGAQGLPIGSGEIESAHRYIIQKLL